MRCLVAARQSRVKDETTGIERQDEQARRWVDQGEHEFVALAADTDISGDTDPWRRPELGPWLSDPELIDRYDAIVASHVDRLARSTVHFMRLLHWADDHGKRVITLGEQGIDFSSPVGKLLGYIISWLGEQELAATKRRWESTHRWLKEHGYLVGKPMWGYVVAPHPDDPKRKTLKPDPLWQDVLREMIERAMRGDSYRSICDWLDDKGIPAPSGGKWWAQTVKKILKNPMLYGRRMTGWHGEAEKRTVLRVEPLITYDDWARLQESLKPRNPGGLGKTPGPLSGAVICPRCDRPMHINRTRHRDRVYSYIKCGGRNSRASECRNSIREDALLNWVEDKLIGRFGDREVVNIVRVAGAGHDHEIEMVAQEMKELTARYTEDELTDEEHDREMERLRAERKRLRALPPDPDRVEERPTGVTVAERWRSLDDDGKRDYLRRAKVRIYAQKDRDGALLADLRAERPEALMS